MSEHRKSLESSPAARTSSSGWQATPVGSRPRNQSLARAVGAFVPRLTQKAMQKFGFSTAQLLTEWPQIVGADTARYTSPLKLKWPKGAEAVAEALPETGRQQGAVLHISVDAARALDIEYKRAQIMERINRHFGYRAVSELKITQRPLAQPPLPRQVINPKPRTSGPAPDLGVVQDEALRAALERLQRGIGRR